MAYTKVNWTELVPITPANLDQMDTGISDVAAGLSGTFGAISSGSASSNSTIAVPSLVGPYVELTLRGSLDAVGFVGITVNGNTGIGYEWTMGHVRADGVAESYEGTSDTAWIVGRWSTVLSVATIRVYGQLGNPNATASMRFDSMSGRHSTTTANRFGTHSTGRTISTASMTSIGVASRDAGWSSYDWQLCGFKA